MDVKFLNPKRNSCGFKNIRIRVDTCVDTCGYVCGYVCESYRYNAEYVSLILYPQPAKTSKQNEKTISRHPSVCFNHH